MSQPANRVTYIAGNLTSDDWLQHRQKLRVGSSTDEWLEASSIYLRQRLVDRYFLPIKAIQSGGTYRGEGFSIVSIQCALLEFLAALRGGLIHRSKIKKAKLKPWEYTSSGSMLCGFLCRQRPFKSWFDEDTAADFYSSVRCPLLHETRTRNGWVIWAKNPMPDGAPIDVAAKVVYRDDLQAVIETYVDDYCQTLLRSAALQTSFIRKFDDFAA